MKISCTKEELAECRAKKIPCCVCGKVVDFDDICYGNNYIHKGCWENYFKGGYDERP